MRQDNTNYENHRNYCEDTVKKIIIEYLGHQEIPKLTEETWESLLSKYFDRRDYYFLKLMLKNEVYEESPYIDEDITEELIEKECSVGIIPERVIRFSKVKVALIKKHTRFIHNAIKSYVEINEAYEQLPKKHISLRR